MFGKINFYSHFLRRNHVPVDITQYFYTYIKFAIPKASCILLLLCSGPVISKKEHDFERTTEIL